MNGLDSQRWIELWRAAGGSGEPLAWFHKLQAAYSEPHRYYHNSPHIAECLREFDAARQLAWEPLAVELAIWFHDAVYDPRKPDNEERSAELAEHCMAEAGLGRNFGERVPKLVMATKHHDVSLLADAPLIVDVDLGILGQPESRFMEYEAQIRQEYSWVPEATFVAKRAEILESFLARERLYVTDWFYQKYEQPARSNLRTSLRRLKNRRL